MFDKMTPISPASHRASGWIDPADMTFAADQAVVSVVMAEVMMLKDMPIAFARNTSDGPFSLVAVQSLHSGYNLYVDASGKWVGRYLPLLYRCYPFKMMPIANTEQSALCVEEGEYFHVEADELDQRLFDDDGNMSDVLEHKLKLAKMFEKSARTTQKLVQQLDDLDLIQPWDLHVQAGSVETAKKVQGLFHVSEAKLRELPAESHQALVKSGAMALVYGQLFSQHCVEFLGLQYRLKNEASSVSASVDETIDDLFDEASPDLFKFD